MYTRIPFTRKPKLKLVKGDITKFECDAIVNAANSALRGGGGVDGAIHKAAGPNLLNELIKFYPNGIDTGEVAFTTAGDLPADFVLHTVGPIWPQYVNGAELIGEDLLRQAYTRTLIQADYMGLSHVAFPAISCGIYKFPLDRAAEIAIETVANFRRRDAKYGLHKVTFVLFDDETLKAFKKAR